MFTVNIKVITGAYLGPFQKFEISMMEISAKCRWPLSVFVKSSNHSCVTCSWTYLFETKLGPDVALLFLFLFLDKFLLLTLSNVFITNFAGSFYQTGLLIYHNLLLISKWMSIIETIKHVNCGYKKYFSKKVSVMVTWYVSVGEIYLIRNNTSSIIHWWCQTPFSNSLQYKQISWNKILTYMSLFFTMKSEETGETVVMRSFCDFTFMNAIAKAADIRCFTE